MYCFIVWVKMFRCSMFLVNVFRKFVLWEMMSIVFGYIIRNLVRCLMLFLFRLFVGSLSRRMFGFWMRVYASRRWVCWLLENSFSFLLSGVERFTIFNMLVMWRSKL